MFLYERREFDRSANVADGPFKLVVTNVLKAAEREGWEADCGGGGGAPAQSGWPRPSRMQSNLTRRVYRKSSPRQYAFSSNASFRCPRCAAETQSEILSRLRPSRLDQTLDSKLTIIVRRPLVDDRSFSGICIRTKIAKSLARSAHLLLELTDRLLGPGSRLAPGPLLPFSPIIQGRLPTKLHVAERCCPL
jgi:hypothetical protein